MQLIRLLAVFVYLVLIGYKIGKVEFVSGYVDEFAHVGSDVLGKGSEIEIALLLFVEELEDAGNLVFGSLNLEFAELVFEVGVGHVAIAVFVELSVHLEHFHRTHKYFVLQLPQHVLNTT